MNFSENPQRRLFWFRRLALAGALLAACVVVLGAWVRLTNAGLGCPDWPGCYGHLYPQAAHTAAHGGFQFAKALHEMIHRYFATTLGIIIIGLLVWAARFRADRGQPLIPVALLFVVVCLQGALGRPDRHSAAQAADRHRTSAGRPHHPRDPVVAVADAAACGPLSGREAALRKYALLALSVLIVQIALGGWTSTNYAAVACPDFPTCQHSWWPPMDYRDAFVLWRGLDIDYQGGVLANPARVAIHFTHRLGALVAGSILIGLGILTVARARSRRLAWAGTLLLFAVTLADIHRSGHRALGRAAAARDCCTMRAPRFW